MERKAGKEIPESLRLQFRGNISANDFALPDAQNNTSGPLNRASIADFLVLKTLLVIRQK